MGDYDHVTPSNNRENYFTLKDENGDVMEEDREDFVRTYYSYKACGCVFPNCSDNAWTKALKSLWSVESADKVVSYLKQHAVSSTNHCLDSDNPLARGEVDRLVNCIKIEERDDTFEDRKSYRESLDEQKKRKAEEETNEERHKRKRGRKDWSAKDWGSQSWGDRNDWADAPAVNADLVNLQGTVQHIASSVQALCDHVAQPGQPGPSSGVAPTPIPSTAPQWAFDVASAVDAQASVWNPSMLAAVQEQTITLPYSQLLLYKETIQRAREAAKSAMASMLEPLNKLRGEIAVLANAEGVVDDILKKAHKGA